MGGTLTGNGPMIKRTSIGKWTFQQQQPVQVGIVHDASELSLAGETGSRSFLEVQAGVFETISQTGLELKGSCLLALRTAEPPAKRQYEPLFLPCAKRPLYSK